MDFEQPN